MIRRTILARLGVCLVLLGLLASPGAQAQQSLVAEMSLGNPQAPITVIEYSSFTCPHCANFHRDVFPQLKAEYIDTGKVSLVYREVYFDRFGLWASLVARCDGARHFFAITDTLFAEQKAWIGSGDPQEIIANLRRIGRQAGLGDDRLDTCLSDNEHATALVAWFQRNAERDGVRSTPSFVINGDLYSNMSLADFRGVLDGLLAQ
ncbi:DsbA family protein [Thalassococcus sp. CAU 1522]|uniref:DsbA family protein n=1 Tax=Thalassococcus arenae TaxID=2851652 RepID=A0ABS6N834_9RHOB|nr:DsbA family protein [Thalassococcus arenae]MBV2360153.1 DsbA family protein [Thalassococcus arenae]